MQHTPPQNSRIVSEVKLVKVAVANLKIGMHVVNLDRPWLETPFILQGFVIRRPEDIEELARYCEYVEVEESHEFVVPAELRFVEKGHKTLRRRHVYSSELPVAKEIAQAQTLYTETRALTRSLLDDVRLGRAINVEQVKTTVSACVKSILRNPDAMMWLSRIRDRDNYTAEHSLNVGLLAITFGRHLGVGGDDLQRLGICGMLHDVGKMITPLEILNKEGPLNDQEFQVMRNHAAQGRNILVSHRTIFTGTVDVAHSHHEMLDGSGYPRKLPGASISELTRIVTLCDVYDAITSDRCYKDGKSSLDALNILYKERETRFDRALTEKFIECIGIYPPGSIVELHTGEIGLVLDRNLLYRHLPKVLILLDTEQKATEKRVVDLERLASSDKKEELIKTTRPNGSFGIRVENFIKEGLMLG
jgi:HD-GYP domain-containing protein (c-di-GMP phosphodiesterase class II)